MPSISSIVTRGFGTWGGVNDIPTRGYGIGAAVVVDSVSTPGLQWTATDGRLHYASEDERLHYASNDWRAHYKGQ